MADLGQHAAQIAALAALWRGDFGWSELVTINWLTPYLAAYPLGAALSFLLPVNAVIALLLTLAYLATVITSMMLARRLEAPEALDWLLVTGFFGAYWTMGGLSFLLALPLVFLFILTALEQHENYQRRRNWLLLALGVLLFCGHALA